MMWIFGQISARLILRLSTKARERWPQRSKCLSILSPVNGFLSEMRIFNASVPKQNLTLLAITFPIIIINQPHSFKMSEFKQQNNLRINAIIKDDDSLKISMVANARTTIAKLKRQVQQEFHQLHGVTVLISVIEDGKGFVLSNNSAIGEHVRNNETIYVQTHKEKMGASMNLPNNITDLFMTLRYVCSSVIKKLENLQTTLDPLDVVPQIIHLGFWYSNAETVVSLCRFLNKMFTPEVLEHYYKNAHDMQNILLLKLFNFWLAEVKDSFSVFPEVGEELLGLLQKLAMSPSYAQLLRTSKLMKNVMDISKDGFLAPQLKKMAMTITRTVNGKGLGMKTTSAYIPTALGQSNATYLSNIQQVLEGLSSNNQQAKRQALEQLAQNRKLISQACVRFDYYNKLISIFTIKNVKDKVSIRLFNTVMREVTANTTKQKAKEVMQKDIIRRIHNFLLESHPQAHQGVYEFYSLIAKESASKGLFNVQQANEFLTSPYLEFQRITIDSLSEMSEKDKQTSSIRFLPSIKDYIRLCLKTENQPIANGTLKIISNLTLDEQCRYQIINLKGIEVFIKFLEAAEKNNNGQLQRTCAKGLLNLSLSSRQIKAKILSLMVNILDRFYKGSLDVVAGNYVQNLLKSAKN